MTKTIGMAVLIMTLPFLSIGQDKLSKEKNNLFLRIAPTTLLDLEGGLSVGLEYKLHNNISFVFEPTLLLWNWAPDGNSATVYNPYQLGYKLKPEIRYYFERKRTKRRPGQNFIAYEFMFKHTNQALERDFGFFCNSRGTNCAFLKRDLYRKIKEVFSHSLKFGLQREWRRNWLVEYYFGIGVRTKTFNYKDVPENAFFLPGTEDARIIDLNTEDMQYPSFPMGIKLVKILK